MKTPLILLFAFPALLSSCASLQPETTANGESARDECLALQVHCQEMEKRLAAVPATKGTVRNPDKRIAIQLIVIETQGRKSHKPVEQARVLSESEMTEQVKAFQHKGRIITYPRMVTKSGRSVSFQNAVNHPFAKSIATDAIEVDYLPIGTLIGAVPTLLANSKIHLTIDLTRSEITGTEHFQRNPYPTVASQQHTGTYQLATGDTVFIELPTSKGGTLQLFATATTVPKP